MTVYDDICKIPRCRRSSRGARELSYAETSPRGGNIGSNIAAINGHGIMYRPNNDRNKLTSYFMRQPDRL